MFQGSRNVEPEAHLSMISRVGGQSNANTDEDVTIFWQTAPAQYLPLMLWLERIGWRACASIEPRSSANGRSSRKSGACASRTSRGRLPEIIFDSAFRVHPYKHQPIGSMADLEAASIEDVQDFYRTFYVPTNATLTIVGDFDARAGGEVVEQCFGRIPKPARAVPRDIPAEPPMEKERRVTLEEGWRSRLSSWRTSPTTVIRIHAPLHVASKILSDGQSSRIYRRLVYDTGVALAASGEGNIIEHPNLFYVLRSCSQGTRLRPQKALIAELERLKRIP